jgi:hypothetical protein
MKAKSFSNVNYIGWIVIVTVFIFIYFSYFFIFIPRKEAQLQQKAFRILKEYGNNMLDKNKYFENHFKNYGLFYAIGYLKDSKLIEEIQPEPETRNDTLFNDVKNVISTLLEYVTTEYTTIDSQCIFNEHGSRLYLNYPIKNTDTISADSFKKFYTDKQNYIIDSLHLKAFSNKVPIINFMEGLKFDELFEKITLFDKKGVYYDSNNDQLLDITNPSAFSDTTRKTQGGIHKTINIRGENKHVMVLPISFKGNEFFIAGFISDTDYRHKTRNINTQLVIYIASILLLILIGMPVLKIIFIDPRERLKANDAIGSGLSFIFGLSLLIIIIISLLKNQVVDRAINYQRIKEISNTLYTNVSADINLIKCLGSSIAKDYESCPNELAESVLEHFNSNKKFKQVNPLNAPFQLNEIILIDSSGIVQKTFSRTAFSEVVKFNLSEREYFKNIREINNSWPSAKGLNFYIESIKSYNSGDFETAISFHTGQFDSLPVLAITSKIPSLYHQVLPNDIGFVIIEKTGKVLYHSKKDKNLHENFIQESESDIELIRAINSGTKQNLRINYDEKKWLARIVPVEDTPLFHITLLDLNSTGNNNARIFLFTFYFFIISFLFLSASLLMLSMISRASDKTKKHFWILHWITFHPEKYNLYKALSTILLVIIIFQFFGILFAKNPIHNIIYQLILIFYLLFVSVYLFTRNSLNFRQFFQAKFLPGFFILIVVLFLIISFLYEFNLFQALIIPSIFIFLFSFSIPFILKYFKTSESTERVLKFIPEEKRSRFYLIFLTLWIAGLSAVPVIQYYFSFKNQERQRWNQEQTADIARKNIGLFSEFGNINTEWFKRIQGNNIDKMNIKFEQISAENFDLLKTERFKNKTADSVLTLLPDPISHFIKNEQLSKTENYINEWIDDGKLFFEQGNLKGSIQIDYPILKLKPSPFWYFGIIVLVFTVLLLTVWLLLKYLSEVILNLKQEKPYISKLSWYEEYGDKTINRILLKTFNGSSFLNESGKLKRGDKVYEIKNLKAAHFISTDYNIELLLKDTSEVIWIDGFRFIITETGLHEKLIANLNELARKTEKLIVFNIPFEVELINEFYDNYIEESELKPEEENQLILLKKKWLALFENYSQFNGYLHQTTNEQQEVFRIEDRFINVNNTIHEIQFPEIWKNLTSYEKIVLHDLAEDSLLNQKNTEIIRNLIDKGLIIPYPEPKLFSTEFKRFVQQNLKSDEIKKIEKKLGIKGRWHNARYLILLIIVPLIALILISQGLSIEKIFGIFAGGIAAVTGLLRLFDSSFFKSG